MKIINKIKGFWRFHVEMAPQQTQKSHFHVDFSTRLVGSKSARANLLCFRAEIAMWKRLGWNNAGDVFT
jgi:hypothetical protein